MHHGAVFDIAEIMRLGPTASHQFIQVIGVVAVGVAVTEHSTGRAQQGQAAQFGERLLEFAHQGLLFVARLRLFDDR
ncbi:hypothetical protein D3C78_1605040 [compost metagenome]